MLARDVKAGQKLIIKNAQVEVTYCRRSRQYTGYQTIQYRVVDTNAFGSIDVRLCDEVQA